MAYSMTGFGRAEKIYDTRRYTVEIKSVNNRYCDINMRLPRLFNFAETALRKKISDSLGRGKVDVYIYFEDRAGEASEVSVNTGLAKAYSDAARLISEQTGRTDDLTASRLMTFQDVMTVRQADVDEDRLQQEILEVLGEAIDGMLKMRRTEGDTLKDDLLSKVRFLEGIRLEIGQRAPLVVEEYRKRLSDRIDEILDSDKRAFYDDARLAAEVAVFADKAAIDEELSRLQSHFSQAEKILGNEQTVGKKMDFLVQEINREVNTIGSKANDIEITNRVLTMKNEIEKIREQIQNLV